VPVQILLAGINFWYALHRVSIKADGTSHGATLRVCLVFGEEGWDGSIPVFWDGMVASLLLVKEMGISLLCVWLEGWGCPCHPVLLHSPRCPDRWH